MLHNLLKTYRTTSIRCCTTSSINVAPLKALTTDPSPVFASVGTFAPATVANLGPCFDFLGCAVDGLGDHVTLAVHPGQISIYQITAANDSVGEKLTKNPNFNCAGIAALAVKKMLDIRSVGLSR